MNIKSQETSSDTRNTMRLPGGHSLKRVTDLWVYGLTDGQIDTPSYRDAWPHLKRWGKLYGCRIVVLLYIGLVLLV